MTAREARCRVPELMEAHGNNVQKVANQLGRSIRFVQRWQARARAGLGFGNKPGGGRPNALSSKAVAAAKRMAEGDKPLPARIIAQRLLERGYTDHKVNSVTVLRYLRTGTAPVKYLPLIRRHLITPAARRARIRWAEANRNREWAKVLFVDSKVLKLGKTSGQRRLQSVRRRKSRTTRQHGLSIHMYAGCSVNGCTNLQFVSGTTGFKFRSRTTGRINRGVRAEEYQDVIERTLLPEGRRLFNGARFTVLQDGASAHTAGSTIAKWSQIPEVDLLQGAPRSPDLNLQENVWQALSRYMDGRDFRNISDFKRSVSQVWEYITSDFCGKLFASMPHRVEKVIEQQGGHIERNVYSYSAT